MLPALPCLVFNAQANGQPEKGQTEGQRGKETKMGSIRFDIDSTRARLLNQCLHTRKVQCKAVQCSPWKRANQERRPDGTLALSGACYQNIISAGMGLGLCEVTRDAEQLSIG